MRDLFTVTARDPQRQSEAQGIAELLETLMEPYWEEWIDAFRELALAEAFYGADSPQFREARAAMEAKKEEIVSKIKADLG